MRGPKSAAIPPLPPGGRAGPARAARLLGNGEYGVLITASGGGFSWWRDHALTGWRADPVRDDDGLFVHLFDPDRGFVGSLGGGPPGDGVADPEAGGPPGRFRIRQTHRGIEARLDVCVAPDAPVEIRRVRLRNRTRERRRIEVTTCAEVVLHRPAAHAAHPAFSRLFVRTEFESDSRALLVRRRPREAEDSHPWLFHALLERDPRVETSRDRFLGRGGRPERPRGVVDPLPGPGSTGDVLDPIVSLGDTVVLEPGGEATSTFLLGVGADRDAALATLRALANGEAVEAAFEAAHRAERARRDRCGLRDRDAEYFHALARAVLSGDPALMRAEGTAEPASPGPADGRRRAPHLPLVLVRAPRPPAPPGAPDLAGGPSYWEELGLPVEVVTADPSDPAWPRLLAEARAVIDDRWPALAADGEPSRAVAGAGPAEAVRPEPVRAGPDRAEPSGEDLELFNGFGGFADDGREYVIRIPCRGDRLSRLPPRPWINVLANERFGCLVSETGAGTTWSRNSREHRITPWSNDPILDPHSEALWIRDEDSGAFGSPLPGPAPRSGDYEVRHGFGFTRCVHESDGLREETTIFVPRRDTVRVAWLRLENRTRRRRRLSVFSYARLVLGDRPSASAGAVRTSAEDGVLFAVNPRAGRFADGKAFAAVVAPAGLGALDFTGDRASFLGRGGSLESPRALRSPGLDGRVGPGLDPCFAHRARIDLAPGESADLAFLLGEASGREEARDVASRLAAPGALEASLDEVRAFWSERVGAVRVATPSRALDVMVNGWLPYQTIACRLWARTAFYQSGGAFGFRDQLQDAAALRWLGPEITRDQILLHAAHQFVEGDVLHWWHPPGGRGLRTRFADDLLWLPAVTAEYVHATGDAGVLDETVRFVRARALAPGEDEALVQPEDAGESADVWEHCCRALDRSLPVGAHGLPLFGTGDWNDGMNRVGREGRGESVWMAFFLGGILGEFAPLCRARGEGERADRYEEHRRRLAEAVERSAWDGEWYLRAFHDDGARIGSRESDECRIDALVQAWSVLSGLAPPERADRALDAVDRLLVSERDRLIRLLAPPFDATPHDPGYIKGYVPGVRENGGQYTHAALWVVAAMARRGRRDRVAALLDLLHPVGHTLDEERVARYGLEPYVVAADVYGEPPHVGRGGWSWYTGSSGWMYRVALESLLGLTVVGGTELRIRPCIPDDWPGFDFEWRPPGRSASWRIVVARGAGGAPIAGSLDGAPLPCEDGAVRVPLEADGGRHEVEITLGPVPGAAR